MFQLPPSSTSIKYIFITFKTEEDAHKAATMTHLCDTCFSRISVLFFEGRIDEIEDDFGHNWWDPR